MNRNGYGLRGREYYPPEDDRRRREAEWNQYVGHRSPPRSMTEDYPCPPPLRPREYDVRERRGRSRSPIFRPPPYRERSPYPERPRSPYLQRIERIYRGRSRSPHRERSPYRSRSRSPYRSRSRSRSPYIDRSRSPFRSRSGSPERDYDRDDSPRRDYRHRDERRSPEHRSRESTWSRGACSTVVLRDVPGRIDDAMIQEEVERFGAPIVTIKMEYEQGPRGANERVCVVEFEGTRDATEWMQEHEGLLRLDGEKISMEYRNELDVRRGGSPGRLAREKRYDDDKPFRDSPPSDTMIVKGLDRTTDEKMVRRSFEYITHFPIVDIRLVRDKFGMSRGFCFVQWKSMDDCKQVLEYLRNATPRFHIDGKHVILDYSTPHGGAKRPRSAAPTQSSSSSTAINAAVQVAEAAIQAAHWSRGDKDQKKQVVPDQSKRSQEAKVSRPAGTTAAASAAPAARTTTTTSNDHDKPKNEPTLPSKPQSQPSAVLQPGQYPTPDTSKFQYDPTSGYYYDPITGLYYDANTRYFYNSITRQYLYWDQNKRNYIPISNEAQMQHAKAADKDKKEKEQKEQKKITAKKIAKDMERWAKAQNKKKEEIKKLLEDTPTTTQTVTPTPVNTFPVSKRESSSADAAFSLLEQETSEAERRAAVKAVYHEDPFKRPDMPRPGGRKAAASSGLVSYMKTSDSESEEEEESEQEFEEKLLDWNKMACLLCRRGFPSKEMLQKHKDLSDLHKTNLEQRRKKTGTLVKPKANETPTKYRDRAAERRKNIGSIAPPGRKRGGGEFRAPVPYVQPTKDGLDESNIGNKMLQKMGWNKGSGLGKSQSGITDPIQVQQRSRGVGLGMRGATYGLDGTEGDYRTAAKKITQARYMEMDE